MKKTSLVILPFIVLFFSGCGTTLKQQWYDFTAYYNTFYNANQYFDAGLEKNSDLRSDINPNELIRIHPPPTTAGAEDFERSIEKSADILRWHGRSKYVDDAIELIGASFFYRREYFAALEKFQELYATTTDHKKKQRASIWEGRTYLELQLYGEGARFMESRIEGLEDWDQDKLSEARAILAQLYAFEGNLHQAGNQLILALEHLEDRELRPRAYYHYGQIMERIENLQQAGFAFGEIRNMRPSFDLEYNANLKEAEILRKTGELEEASRRLRSMERNNKFFDYRLELLYEIAKTERMQGNKDESEALLNRVIHSRTTVPEQPLLAKTYYELADLYRFDFHNYEIAAAYYDSAASVGADRSVLPQEWDADDLARAFGEYASVKQEISHLDSLLRLGKLPAEEFEAKIAEIQSQRIAEMEELRMESERMEDQYMMIDPADVAEATTDVGVHGFLNVNNRTLLEQSSMQFRSVWGDRPLADNWRRREAVTGSRRAFDNQRAVIQPEETSSVLDSENAIELQLDLSEIPFEESEQDSVQMLMYEKYHQLGNVFLMNLNMPDSAKSYFERVVTDGPEGTQRASSLYALADIYLQQNLLDEALYWARELVHTYPGTAVAERIASRTELELPMPVPVDSLQEIEQDLSENGILTTIDDFSELTVAERKAADWKRKAETERDREQAARFLFEAAGEYIRAARGDTLYEVKQNLWQHVERHSKEEASIDSLLRGEIDTLSVNTELLNVLGFESDQPVTPGDLAGIYPYQGELWDRAREILSEIRDTYRGTPPASKAVLLLDELNRYPLMARDPSERFGQFD